MITSQEYVLEQDSGNYTEDGFNLELLRQKINSEEYLNEAIQRIALVLTNELLDISPGGMFHGRQKRRR